jgi:DNA-binding protein Fis
MNLEDFSHLLAFRKPKEIEQENEVKEIYEKKLRDIQREFENRLQVEIKKAFEKGLTEGKEKAREEFEKCILSNKFGNLYSKVIGSIEKKLITHVLKMCNGNQSKAARILGITRNTLRTKMKTYNTNLNTAKIYD